MVGHFCNFQVFFANQCSQRSAIADDQPLFATLWLVKITNLLLSKQNILFASNVDWKNTFTSKLHHLYDSHSLNGDPPLFMQNKCLHLSLSFQGKKETPTQVFSRGIFEIFRFVKQTHLSGSFAFWLVKITNLLSKQNILFALNVDWKKNKHLPVNCIICATNFPWMGIHLYSCRTNIFIWFHHFRETKRLQHWNVFDLLSYTLHIIWQGVHPLVK